MEANVADRKTAAQKNASPEVDAWFDRLDHPLKPAMQRVRAIILGADARISETIKWSTPTWAYKGNLASLQPKSKRFVSLMFHRGAEIPGQHPDLDGAAALVRTMRFDDEAGVDARRKALEAVVRAWCEWRERA
jgi:hypothetical protein